MKTTTNKSLIIDLTDAIAQLTEEDWKEIMNNAKAIARAQAKGSIKIKRVNKSARRGGSNV